MRKLITFVLITIAFALLGCDRLQAQTPVTASPPETQTAASKYFTDVELVDQNGTARRFYSDLIKGHTVVIIPFFATCTNVCPPMNATMRKVQQALGSRVGKDVVLISLTVDPVNDTPLRLKEYAARFHAEPGWYFVSGNPENVNIALQKLGMKVADKNDHNTIMIIGNEPTGLWKKAYALSRASDLTAIIEGVADDGKPAARNESAPGVP
ncbi:MAG TPA: SCO family protein [Pyrinomonadaceae bacterium]|nr:SCO family protein [Pyrinomonadaceae bacterium]